MNQDEFLQYVLDQLSDISGITSRAMFGGHGIYKDGFIFALIADEKIYFKVDESNKTDFEEQGMEPFTYQRKNHPKTTMSYYELPVDILEDREELRKWVEKAVEVSKRAKKK